VKHRKLHITAPLQPFSYLVGQNFFELMTEKKNRPIQLTSKDAEVKNRSNHYILEHILNKIAICVSYRKALKPPPKPLQFQFTRKGEVYLVLSYFFPIVLFIKILSLNHYKC